MKRIATQLHQLEFVIAQVCDGSADHHSTCIYTTKIFKILAPSSIHNYSILILIIVKDEGPKVFKLVKTNAALDFFKNNTCLASTS